jgi:AraC-like DNA-binding protein
MVGQKGVIIRQSGAFWPAMDKISPVYARIVLRELTASGIESRRVLDGTTLDREQLESGGDIAIEDFVTILRNGRRIRGDERLGLVIGRSSHLLNLGPVAAAVAFAPTIREGLQALENYSRLHASYMGITLSSSLEGMSIGVESTQSLGDTERYHYESGVMLAQSYLETITGERLEDARYSFSFPCPDYADEYPDYFHSPVCFDAEHTAVELPRHWLERKSPYYHADIWRQAQLELSHRIRDLGADNERAYTQYLSSLLRSLEPPLPDLGRIAAGLHMSERTLTRRLNGEGTSYRQLKSEVLRHWAHQYLLHTRDSVESIAASLGYQDAANFRRAFRQWENCSPQAFRHAGRERDAAPLRG